MSQALKGQIFAALVVVVWISSEGTSKGGSSQGSSSRARSVAFGFKKGHAAEQLGDVIAVEMVVVAVKKGWRIPILISEKTLLGHITPGQWCPPVGAQAAAGNPSWAVASLLGSA